MDRALLRASAVELNRLERRVTFLATTASISPFIGLFGTVWGIMTAFQAIGATGASNLAVVAPGIAEALIATAAGLFAAIPAVYFYNLFTQRVKLFASQMDDFALEFLNICERNFTSGDARAQGADGCRRDLPVLEAGTRSQGDAQPVGNQRRSPRGRDAGAADHLHGRGPDDAARPRREPAGVPAGAAGDGGTRFTSRCRSPSRRTGWCS